MQTNPQKDLDAVIKKIIGELNLSKKPEGEGHTFVSVEGKGDDFIRNFRLKPSELISYLKQKVVKQEEAIRILATKICGHYNAIRSRLENEENPMDDVDRIKNNILLVGSTGVGKTYLLKLICKKIGVPFIKVDATKFTEAGYVGGDVEDIIRDLANSAKDRDGNSDIEMAQFGIVFIDEADKIASCGQSVGIDVSRRGVQQALLTIIEDADVTLKSRMDIGEQIKIIKLAQEGKEPKKDVVNTKNILFILSGAFPGLDEIVTKRISSSTIGFTSGIKKNISRQEILDNLETSDLIRYGFDSEFIGRIPVRATLQDLDEDDFYTILNKPDSPIIMQFKDIMTAYGIRVDFDNEVLRYIAKKAATENTGARGLQSAFNKAVSLYETHLPDINIREFHFILPIVDGTFDQVEFIKHLEVDIAEKIIHLQEEITQKNRKANSVYGYVEQVQAKYSLVITFNEEATKLIERLSKKQKKTACEVCISIFSQYEHVFGLLTNVGRKELVITAKAIDNPVTFLEEAFKS